jgi:hypothetical protein
MRKIGRVAMFLTVLSVVACDRPNRPTPNPDQLGAALLPSNVIPPVVNTEAQGTGTASVGVVAVRDGSGSITSATVDVQLTFAGFPPNTNPTDAHIHRGEVGIEGAVEIDLQLVPGQVTLTSGAGSFLKQGLLVSPSLAQELLTNPGAFYVDVHSVRNVPGMLRGQLQHQ